MPTINNASPISVNPNLTSWRGAMPSLPQQEILMETKMPTPSLWGNIIDLAQAHTYGRRLNDQFDPASTTTYSPLQKALYTNPYTSDTSESKTISNNTQPTYTFPEMPNRADYYSTTDYEFALQNWAKNKKIYDDNVSAGISNTTDTTTISPKINPVKYSYVAPYTPHASEPTDRTANWYSPGRWRL